MAKERSANRGLGTGTEHAPRGGQSLGKGEEPPKGAERGARKAERRCGIELLERETEKSIEDQTGSVLLTFLLL